MAYFKINGHDYSQCVNALKVDTKHKYTARENASGNTLVKYITSKKTVQVGIIPLDDATCKNLLQDIDSFKVNIDFLNPHTQLLETITCIIPVNSVEYYTIQAGNVRLKAFNIVCEEL